MNPTLPTAPDGYGDWLAQLKTEIGQRRQRAALAVNAELVGLYARIGQDILDRQQRLGWGAKVIERLAHDLKAAFPEMRSFSSRNLKYMAYFAEHCPHGQFGQQAAAQLPWFHIVTLNINANVGADLVPALDGGIYSNRATTGGCPYGMTDDV